MTHMNRNPYDYDEVSDTYTMLSESECELATEALYRLLEIKQGALKEINKACAHPPGRPFTPHDFGIPNISALIKKLQGEEG